MDGPRPARAPDAVIIAIRDRERKRSVNVKGSSKPPAASSNLGQDERGRARAMRRDRVFSFISVVLVDRRPA
jgi:hypothetical protein